MSTVHWFASHDASGNAVAGAPSLTGTAGSLIALLDACLVTGYATTTLTSLTVSGGVATATVQTGHPYLDQQQVLIAGASVSALNGVQRVTRTGATTFTFSTTAADGSASGTITAKLAPVGGWEKVFIGANLAAYRSAAAESHGWYLAVDDTSTDPVLVRGYSAMSSASVGTGMWPAATNNWRKSGLLSGVRGWKVIADSRFVIVNIQIDAQDKSSIYIFGDLADVIPGDRWATITCGWITAAVNAVAQAPEMSLGQMSGHWIAGSSDGVGTSTQWYFAGCSITSAPGITGQGLPYPQPAGGILVSPLYAVDSSQVYRGRIPGLVQPLHPRAALPAPGTLVTGPDGHSYLALYDVFWSSSVLQARPLVDVSGPWR